MFSHWFEKKKEQPDKKKTKEVNLAPPTILFLGEKGHRTTISKAEQLIEKMRKEGEMILGEAKTQKTKSSKAANQYISNAPRKKSPGK